LSVLTDDAWRWGGSGPAKRFKIDGSEEGRCGYGFEIE
jgi:hypothetical protein